jgi:hypothetical protein
MKSENQKKSNESPSLANERRCIRCRGVDISLAEASGGGAWGPTLIRTGGEVEDLAGSGSACLQSMEEASMGQYPIIRMGAMGTHSIHIRNSKI